MNRREAIERVQAVRNATSAWIVSNYDLLTVEALDLAIEALSEPTVSEKESVEYDTETATTTDCISRQQAIEAIESRRIEQWTESDRDYNSGLESALCEINALPSVTPTEWTGEWIPCTKGGLPLTELGRRERQKWYGYKCSKCNFIYKGNALTESPFCQNCGAKMKGEKNE